MRRILPLLCVLLSVGCGDDDSSDDVDDGARDAFVPDDGEVPNEDGGDDGGGEPGPVGVMARLPDGRFGEATETFTIPAPDEGMGIYAPDVQDRFGEVDWDTLDRLYIPAGHYPFINLGNLPDRDPADPLVITNLGGQVRVGGLDHHYLFILGGGSGWVLSGRYDPVSATGDEGFPGHRDNEYANSQDRYGILVDDELVRDSVSGLAIGGGATRFEVEFVEITQVGFAGMLVKTDNEAGATMSDVWIHDNYIHDVVSEGMYLGSTQAQPQHTLEGWEVSYNRVLRAGTESIQLGQLAGDNEVHHNVFGPSAIDWRDAFQAFQDGNLQISIRSGVIRVHHNVFLGAAGSMVGMFGNDVAGDSHADGDGVVFSDNYLAHFRNLGIYGHFRDVSPLTYTIRDSFIRGYAFDRDEVYTDATPPGHIIRQGTNTTPFVVENVAFADSDRLCSPVMGECNGEATNFTGSGNSMTTVEPIEFRAAGLPADFDYLMLEQWTDTASRNGDAPVTYPADTIVMHYGVPYRCADECAPSDVPGESESWEVMDAFPDDVRAVPSSPYADLGLGEG